MTKKKYKAPKTTKWAQLSPAERAWRRAMRAERSISKATEKTVQDKRDQNRYTQLLSHWVKLYKQEKATTDTQNSSR